MIIDPFTLIDELVLRDGDMNDERLCTADDANFDVVAIFDTTGTKIDSWGYTSYGYPMHDSWGQFDSTTGFGSVMVNAPPPPN